MTDTSSSSFSSSSSLMEVHLSSNLIPLHPSIHSDIGEGASGHHQSQPQSHHRMSTPPTSAADLSQATRKRMRPEQWNGSTLTPDNFIASLNLPAPTPTSEAQAPTSKFPDTMLIHTRLENIQASLTSSLHASHALPTQSASTSNVFPATHVNPVVPSSDYSGLSEMRMSEDSHGAEQDEHHSGSEPESTPVTLPPSSSRSESRSSPTSFRRSKQRVIEKQRRDELKKHMQILSSLIDFSNPTNKIGVVMAAITYVRQQQALLEAERTCVKNLEVSLAESQNKLQELGSQFQKLNDERTSTTTVADNRDTVSMTKYESLLNQFRELQVSYSELANSKQYSVRGKMGENKMDEISDSPFSPMDFNVSGAPFHSHAEFQGDFSQQQTREESGAVGFHTPTHQVARDASQMSPVSSIDSPFTTSLLFNSETTPRLLTRDGIIVEISPKMLRDLGFERHELIGKPMSDITPLIKQPMTRLTSYEEHEAEPLTILDSFKTKQGGIIFLSGLLEIAWDVAKCSGKKTAASGSATAGPAAITHEKYSYTCTDNIEAISVNPGFCNATNQNVNHFYFHPCEACGQRPRFGMFTGLPTSHTDMEEHIRMSVKNVVRLFDPEINREGLRVDEFFTRGKVSYESTQQKSGKTVRVRVTKFLPMPFVQG